MIYIRRGGSNETTKNKEERFVQIHPKIAELLETTERTKGMVFQNITERKLLSRLKKLCQTCDFDKPREYNLRAI